MTRTGLLIGVWLTALLSACAGVEKVRYSPLVVVDRPARPPNQVEAFLTQKPSRPYQEIGVLSYRAGTAEQYVDVVQYMREKAAQLGADGVIMMGSNAGPSMIVGHHMIGTMRDFQAMAIIYKK
jgi:hypothetical protein